MPEVILNLGAGEKPLQSATNVDIRELPGIDLVADASKLPLPDNHADRILAADLIEHFGWQKTVEVLKEWHRVLKPGGTLILKTPNMETLARALFNPGIPQQDVIRKIFGGQDYPENTHIAGFTPDLIRTHLGAAGFHPTRLVEAGEGGDWSNMVVRAVKP